jgi:hypothetical protein
MQKTQNVAQSPLRQFAKYEVASAAIGVGVSIFTMWKNFDPLQSCILGIVTTILILVARSEYLNGDSAKKLGDIEDAVTRLHYSNKLAMELGRKRHPHFQRLLAERIDKFMADNKPILDEATETSPQSAETFGIEGLRFTKNRLRCLSSIPTYWDDRRNLPDTSNGGYLAAQKALIDSHKINIERIFVFCSADQAKYTPIMRAHKKAGVDVWFVLNDDAHNLETAWLEEDYLIQDDSLLVDLVDWQSPGKISVYTAREIITANPAAIAKKLRKYDKIKSVAARFHG